MQRYWILAAIIIGMAVIAAVLGVVAVLLRQRHDGALPEPRHPPVPANADRAALVELCIDLGDRIDNPALLERLTRTLADVGISTVPTEDAMLDPAQHRVVDRTVATDPELHNRIATTERRGYLDHGQLLRPADVTVYHVG